MNTSLRMPRRGLLAALAIAASVVVTIPSTALAYDETSASAINVDTRGVALKGYDPVTYFGSGGPQQGKEQFTAQHDGATYHFISTASRDAFLANPGKYAPAFGGFCAMGVALEKKLDVDPQAWKVVDGKLYLNVNKDVQKRWLDNVPGNISQANSNWPKLKDKVPKTL